jgi:hypothetical protein
MPPPRDFLLPSEGKGEKLLPLPPCTAHLSSSRRHNDLDVTAGWAVQKWIVQDFPIYILSKTIVTRPVWNFIKFPPRLIAECLIWTGTWHVSTLPISNFAARSIEDSFVIKQTDFP